MTENHFLRIDSNREDERWNRIHVGEIVAEVEAYSIVRVKYHFAKPSITGFQAFPLYKVC